MAVWPRQSWSRSLKYFGKRVLRLSASPHAIAAGFACGVLVSWTPLFGFHFMMAVVVAFFIGGNVLAALFGTVVGNPLTFPFMWWGSYTVGHWLLGHELGGAPPPPMRPDLFHAPWQEIVSVLEPMLVGALPLGVISGLIAYFIVRAAVRAYQGARRERLAARRGLGAGSAASES
ncbi:DUF2062 domain-containing protein [Bauldia sp.]|uniref:DUF2062 domain-containing protein n=1 Tax=Bauldia sp. TaxID=2575872 RepID=UPI0025BC24AF|nr:DUF2062 domain-containing protein [Bauldia sp.]